MSEDFLSVKHVIRAVKVEALTLASELARAHHCKPSYGGCDCRAEIEEAICDEIRKLEVQQ